MVVSISATNQLTERFDLIKVYLLRYKVHMVITSAAKSYLSNLKKSKDSFDAGLNRITGRLSILSDYNRQTRYLLFAQNLDYDMRVIQIPDVQTITWVVQFSHSLLLVSRRHCNSNE